MNSSVSGFGRFIAIIRPLEPDLTLEQKAELLGEIAFIHDHAIERLAHDVTKLRTDMEELRKEVQK